MTFLDQLVGMQLCYSSQGHDMFEGYFNPIMKFGLKQKQQCEGATLLWDFLILLLGAGVRKTDVFQSQYSELGSENAKAEFLQLQLMKSTQNPMMNQKH